MSNKTHLIMSFTVAAVACLWLFIPGVKELAADNIWYIESGRQLIGFNIGTDNLIFSPVYSLLAFTWFSISSNLISTISIAIEGLACFIFSAFTWYLLLSIPRFALAPRLIQTKRNQLKHRFLLALFVFNPVLLKYSLPLFSDSYSVIGGTLFTFYHGINKHLFHKEDQKAMSDEVDPISKGLLNLHRRPSIYFSLISILCLFRYGNFFLLLASILFYLGSNKIEERPRLNHSNIKAFRLLLLTISSAITIKIIDFVLGFYRSSILNLFNNLSHSVTPSKLAEKLLAVLILTIGGREGFRWAINDPTALLDFNTLQNQYLALGYHMSLVEYLLSFAYLSLMIIAFFISTMGMWKQCRQIMWPYIIGTFALLITEAAINIAHQRYFLPFIPSLYLGLFYFVFYQKIHTDTDR